MPGRNQPLSETGIIADLLKRQRGHGIAIRSVSSSDIWKHQAFTVATNGTSPTLQLNYIPKGINAVAWGAVGPLIEDVDFTVDYTTGLITLSSSIASALKATPAPADTIFVSYVTTGDLVAQSQTPDPGLPAGMLSLWTADVNRFNSGGSITQWVNHDGTMALKPATTIVSGGIAGQAPTPDDASGPGGGPCVKFTNQHTGYWQGLLADAPLSATNRADYWVIVASWVALPPNVPDGMPMAASDTANNHVVMGLVTDANSVTRLGATYGSQNRYRAQNGNNSTVNGTLDSSTDWLPPASYGDWCIYEVWGITDFGDGAFTDVPAAINLGSMTNDYELLVAAMYVQHGEPTNAERNQVLTYFGNKYGISVTLQ